MDTKSQQMEMIHEICQKELSQLQINMECYLQDSERIQKQLKRRSAAVAGETSMGHRERHNNMFALIAFDRYMSQMTSVIGMARKFNIHLQLNSLLKTVIDTKEPLDSTAFGINGAQSHASKSRFLQDFIKWSNIWNSPEPEVNSGETFFTSIVLDGTDGTSTARKAIESIESAKSKGDPTVKKKEDPSKAIHIKFNDLDTFVRTILPLKDLSHFKEGYTFSAHIIYVQDYENLVFFVYEKSDSHKLLEIANSKDLESLDRSPLPHELFYVSQDENDSVGEGSMFVWRAVKIPEELEEINNSALLVDVGEQIQLTEWAFYRKTSHFQNIPPLAIKCLLKGLCNVSGVINSDSEKCRQTLVENEYQMARFRVISLESRVLHVVLLIEPTNNPGINPKTESKMISGSNPFLDALLLEEEVDEENEDVLLLPISTLYDNKPKCQIYPNIIARIGESLQVTVTHVYSPIGFFATIEGVSEETSKVFFWNKKELTPLQKQITSPKINDIVLALYSKDDHWYRAKVTDIMPEEDLYKVYYIDFGNIEIVSLNSLALCTWDQLDRPPQAVPFRLADLEIVNVVASSNRVHSDEVTDTIAAGTLMKATEALNVIIINQTINVKVVDRNGDELTVHIMDDHFTYIPSMLINMGVVRKSQA